MQKKQKILNLFVRFKFLLLLFCLITVLLLFINATKLEANQFHILNIDWAYNENRLSSCNQTVFERYFKKLEL